MFECGPTGLRALVVDDDVNVRLLARITLETIGFTVEEGSAVTLCFEIFNQGDTPLVGLELTDTVLGLELADLSVVFGDPTARITAS